MYRVTQCGLGPLRKLFDGYGLGVQLHEPDADIPGSFWGAPEAGLADGAHVGGLLAGFMTAGLAALLTRQAAPRQDQG